MNTPNNCYFCDTHDHVQAMGKSGLYNVVCPTCHAGGPDAGLYDTAIARWNDTNPDREKVVDRAKTPPSSCPWCKGKHLHVRDVNCKLYWVVCRDCGVRGPEAPSPRLAIALWNSPAKVRKYLAKGGIAR